MSVSELCQYVGMSRQNYYKTRRVRQRRQVDEALIKDLVLEERALQPRIGALKLHHVLRDKLIDAGISIGRDRFFDVLRNQKLFLVPLPKAPRTTDSRHTLPVFTNLIKDMKLTAPNQVWVSDITYIRIFYGFMYLTIITDAFSRKIVGYHLSLTMTAADSLIALEMALRGLPEGVAPIHHTDRGSQYCSHVYVKRLTDCGFKISMTEQNHCAENAMAERVNGILKQEYYLKNEFRSATQARKAVDQAIFLYNSRRLHRSLNFKTPDFVHNLAS